MHEGVGTLALAEVVPFFLCRRYGQGFMGFHFYRLAALLRDLVGHILHRAHRFDDEVRLARNFQFDLQPALVVLQVAVHKFLANAVLGFYNACFQGWSDARDHTRAQVRL